MVLEHLPNTLRQYKRYKDFEVDKLLCFATFEICKTILIKINVLQLYKSKIRVDLNPEISDFMGNW